MSDETTSTSKELIEDDNQKPDDIYGLNLFDHIENEQLAESLKILTKKQVKILEMIYLKEISNLLETTPQNISNHYRKALLKLQKRLK